MEILTLSLQVAAQIAAGEIVERPASVVKELVENAIDAGADSIKVSIRGGAAAFSQVVDNGHGIPANQVVAAFGRHATSKLRVADDLLSLATLGFRGEALPGVAAVSRLTCLTGSAGQPAAVQYTIDQGMPAGPPEPTGASEGATITVERLFRNQPARLKFLKTKATETAQAQRVVARYAMAYPGIRFAFNHDGNRIFATYGTGKLSETLLQPLGAEAAVKPLPVLLETPDATVSGYIGNPDLHRSNRSDICVIANCRWVQDRNLSYAIEQGYANSLPQGRRPVAVISITVPPEMVDVNAHPTKQEVRFRREPQVFGAVRRAAREALSTHGMVHRPAGRPFRTASAPSASHQQARREGEHAPPSGHAQHPRRDTAAAAHSAEPPLVTTDIQPPHNLRDTIPPSASSDKPGRLTSLPKGLTPSMYWTNTPPTSAQSLTGFRSAARSNLPILNAL